MRGSCWLGLCYGEGQHLPPSRVVPAVPSACGGCSFFLGAVSHSGLCLALSPAFTLSRCPSGEGASLLRKSTLTNQLKHIRTFFSFIALIASIHQIFICLRVASPTKPRSAKAGSKSGWASSVCSRFLTTALNTYLFQEILIQ